MLLLDPHETLKFSRSQRRDASWKTDKIPFWNMKRQPAESGKHFPMDDSNELSLNFQESFQRMKNCSSCGKEYDDAVTVCPIDGQTVINQEIKPEKLAAKPEATGTAFNVKLVSPILSAGAYRIFVERSDLFFIQVEGGSKSILAAAAPFLGPAGNIIPLTLWLFTKRKTKAKRQRLETGDPEELLRESENNFKLNLAEIREAAIEAPALFQNSGKAGRLKFLVRHGEKIKCEFADAADMAAAIRLLCPLLSSTLKVGVEWNEKNQRFQKKKTPAVA